MGEPDWWEECRRLRADDPKVWVIEALAAHFNKNKQTVILALYPDKREDRNRKARERSAARRKKVNG